MRNKVSEILDRNPTITLKDLNAELRRELPSKPTITDRHLGRICREMLYTVKKLKAAPVDRYVTLFSNFTIFFLRMRFHLMFFLQKPIRCKISSTFVLLAPPHDASGSSSGSSLLLALERIFLAVHRFIPSMSATLRTSSPLAWARIRHSLSSREMVDRLDPVSYTHLTLPTILLV